MHRVSIVAQSSLSRNSAAQGLVVRLRFVFVWGPEEEPQPIMSRPSTPGYTTRRQCAEKRHFSQGFGSGLPPPLLTKCKPTVSPNKLKRTQRPTAQSSWPGTAVCPQNVTDYAFGRHNSSASSRHLYHTQHLCLLQCSCVVMQGN